MPLFSGEQKGTVLMVFLGNGMVANVLLSNSKGQNAGWMRIATGGACAPGRQSAKGASADPEPCS